jgi:hypothetical protein
LINIYIPIKGKRMKTLILTLLAFAIYFLLVNIIPKADSMRKPYAASVISSRVAAVAATAQSAPQRQPVTGLQTNLPMVASAPETMPAAQASSAGNPDTTEVVVTQPASEPVAALPEVVILEPEVVMVEELEASVPVSSAEESLGTSVEEVSLQMVVPSDQVQLDSFTATVMNGQAGQVVGVFVPGSFALPVLQQPSGAHSKFIDLDDPYQQVITVFMYGRLDLHRWQPVLGPHLPARRASPGSIARGVQTATVAQGFCRAIGGH